ncbi:nucleotidyltransferase family protein [Microbacterium sp. P5_E9]
MADADAVELRLVEAVELATAWVADIARIRDIRLLVIKGDALNRQGLRKRRLSSDVDVLVDPGDFTELCAAIERAGWTPREQTLVGAVWSPHSVSFTADDWPCDIDVHRCYPGLLTDEAQAFETLWSSRTQIRFAGQPVEVPSRAGSAILLALHCLRDGLSQPRYRDELEGLLATPFTDRELAEIVKIADDAGALGTLTDVLQRLGIRPDSIPPVMESEELRAWRARVDADSRGAYFWLVLLRRTPWPRKASVLLQSAWPTRRDLIIAHPNMPDTVRGRTRARLERIPAGLRGLPTALHALTRRR